jgi:glycogen synthase
MRLLVISNLFPPEVLGGYEILCAQICQGLAARGHQVLVLTTKGANTEKKCRLSENLTVIRNLRLSTPFSSTPKKSRRHRQTVSDNNQTQTTKSIEQFKPDLIFIFSQLRLTLGAAYAAEASLIPTLYSLNDFHLRGFAPGKFSLRPRKLARYLLEKFIYPKLTFKGLQLKELLVISKCLRDDLVATGVPVSHASVIYQAIMTESFQPKKNIGQLHNPPRVIYAGQLHHYKGVHHLLKSIKLLESKKIDIKLYIAGSGDEAYTEKLRLFSETLKSETIFCGSLKQSELADLYRQCDILVFPSTWREPFGLTHLEAMSCGTPVISTADGGHGEFLKHEVNALVFTPGNTQQLAEHLETLILHHSLRKKLALTAKHQVALDFSFDRYLNEIEDKIAEMIGVHDEHRSNSSPVRQQ